jgi:hypothetical protein
MDSLMAIGQWWRFISGEEEIKAVNNSLVQVGERERGREGKAGSGYETTCWSYMDMQGVHTNTGAKQVTACYEPSPPTSRI